MNLFAIASKRKDSKHDISGKVIEGFEEKQESMQQELEPLKRHVLYKSNDEVEAEKKTKVGSRSLYLYEEDSWQILVVKPMKKEENKRFCEVLSFWKQRKKRDMKSSRVSVT